MRFHDSFLPDILPGGKRLPELRPGRGTFPIMSQPRAGDPGQ